MAGDLDFLVQHGMSLDEIHRLVGDGIPLGEIVESAKRIVERGDPLTADAQQVPSPAEAPPVRRATPAAAFGEDNTKFLWFPYLPIGDYSVMMADGGTGKTILCCGIAAAVSTGNPLPGEVFDGEGKNVLIVSAEDSGPILKKRLALSGANLESVFTRGKGCDRIEIWKKR